MDSVLWLESRCEQILDAFVGGGPTNPEVYPYTKPDVLAFMWLNSEEQTKEENWKQMAFTHSNAREVVWRVFEEMPKDFAEIGLYADSTISLADLAILDVGFGLLVHDAVRHKVTPTQIAIQVPQVNVVGNSEPIEKAIKWANHIEWVERRLLNGLYNNDRACTLFEQRTGVPVEYVTAYLWPLYPIANLHLFYRQENTEYLFEPRIHLNTGHHGAFGWYRLQCLMRKCFGVDVDFQIDSRVSEQFKRSRAVITELQRLFSAALTPNCNTVLVDIARWASIFDGDN